MAIMTSIELSRIFGVLIGILTIIFVKFHERSEYAFSDGDEGIKENKMREFELVKGYDGKLPVIANVGDGGADFYTAERVVLRSGTIKTLIPTADNKNKPFKLTFKGLVFISVQNLHKDCLILL